MWRYDRTERLGRDGWGGGGEKVGRVGVLEFYSVGFRGGWGYEIGVTVGLGFWRMVW